MLLLLLVSNFTLYRNSNDESCNDLVDETTDTTESEVEIKKKKRKPTCTERGKKVAIKNGKTTKFLP